MTNFISVADAPHINELVKKALGYKADPMMDVMLGNNKKLGLLFLNPSLRTRISTQVAGKNLGMETIVFNVDKEGWALEFAEGAVMNGTTVEHIKDAAPVLGAYFDILCIRTFPSLKNREEDYAETIINQFIKYAGIPIVSLESATLHPLQSLTDVITIKEAMGNARPAEPFGRGQWAADNGQRATGNTRRPKIVLTWAPHIKPLPQCVGNSFAQWINAWGEADFVITHPEGYALDEQFTQGARITYNQDAALEGADFVYVKNWSAYFNYGAMPPVNENWMLTHKKMALTNNGKVMHCLPVRRNLELSDEILDGPDSLVTTQGGNRVWAAQAVLADILRRSP